MRHLTGSICVTLAVLLGSAGESFALPECPDGWPEYTWTNCFGTYTYPKGNKYVGEWKDGKLHGQGTYTFASGNKYVGEWKDNKKHGQGTYTYPSGNKYVGEWKDNKKHGQGTITAFADRRKYVGEWKDGKWHGQGTKTYADGRVEEGIWENHKFKYAKKTTPTVTARKTPIIESGKRKLDWWTAQQAKHKTGTRDATTSSLKPIAKAEFAHKYPKLKSERTVVVKKTPKIESKRNVSKGTSIAGNLGNAIRDNSELLKFSLEYPNLTATQIIARFPEKAKKLLRTFYENYLTVSKCHESSTKYISNTELKSAKKEMRKKEKLFERKMDTDRVWNSAVRVFEQGSIFSGPPAGWQKMAVIYSKDAHFWCNQQYQFLMSYWDTPTAKKGIRKKDF